MISYISASMSPDNGWDTKITKQAIPVVSLINWYRSDYDLWDINYDYQLQSELELYKNVYGNDWFETNSSIFEPVPYATMKNINNTRNENGVHVMKYGTFDDFEHYGYKFFFSFKNIKKMQADNLQHLFRLGKRYFDRKLCNKNPPFMNHVSCIKDKRGDTRFAHILKPSFSRIACVSGKTKTYCYGRSTEYIRDDPFVEY